jgi:hypothetical protein
MLVLHKNGIQNYHGDKKVKHQLYDLSLNSFQRYIFGFLFSIFGCVSSPILNMMLDPFKDRQWQFQIVFLVQKFLVYYLGVQETLISIMALLIGFRW